LGRGANPKNIEHGKFEKQILQKFGKKYRAKPMKIEHFQKGASPHQKAYSGTLTRREIRRAYASEGEIGRVKENSGY
jgi:hypothetical protein